MSISQKAVTKLEKDRNKRIRQTSKIIRSILKNKNLEKINIWEELEKNNIFLNEENHELVSKILDEKHKK